MGYGTSRGTKRGTSLGEHRPHKGISLHKFSSQNPQLVSGGVHLSNGRISLSELKEIAIKAKIDQGCRKAAVINSSPGLKKTDRVHMARQNMKRAIEKIG